MEFEEDDGHIENMCKLKMVVPNREYLGKKVKISWRIWRNFGDRIHSDFED